ncbi:uncharacterized protein LOC108742502 [Agrilus planipennis]|uniref:Uncharacterized protein LOC108742502 n=1 Tax=Agrilus planipennis TaxID=224129 RepID=A0A1W4XL96_AGRPL|nr:uncharacterized protein LOC108742502 [Agrilus planipennis]
MRCISLLDLLVLIFLVEGNLCFCLYKKMIEKFLSKPYWIELCRQEKFRRYKGNEFLCIFIPSIEKALKMCKHSKFRNRNKPQCSIFEGINIMEIGNRVPRNKDVCAF